MKLFPLLSALREDMLSMTCILESFRPYYVCMEQIVWYRNVLSMYCRGKSLACGLEKSSQCFGQANVSPRNWYKTFSTNTFHFFNIIKARNSYPKSWSLRSRYHTTNMSIRTVSNMKLSTTLCVLFLINVTILMSVCSARRCAAFVQGNRRGGVCTPFAICPGARRFRDSRNCPDGTGCCIGSPLRCPRNTNHFITFARDCRPGNDQGRLSRRAPRFIRCCRNAPPRLG